MENSIFIYRDYGNIELDIKSFMDKNNISISYVVKQTGLHHRVVRRYYDGTITRYDKDVLSKFCFVLGCQLSDILKYNKPNE